MNDQLMSQILSQLADVYSKELIEMGVTTRAQAIELLEAAWPDVQRQAKFIYQQVLQETN